jgi:hypothetical protein
MIDDRQGRAIDIGEARQRHANRCVFAGQDGVELPFIVDQARRCQKSGEHIGGMIAVVIAGPGVKVVIVIETVKQQFKDG